MEIFEKLIEEFEKADKPQKNELIRGLLDELHNNPDKTLVLKYSQIAVDLAKENNKPNDIGIFQYNIGVTHWKMRNYKEARKYFKLAAINYNEADNTIGYSQTNMAIGVTHLNQGETRLAINYLRTSAFHFIRSKQKRQMASNYNWLGLCYTKLNSSDTALKYYLKSLKLYEELDMKDGIALSFNSLGLIYHELKKNSLAEEYFNKSIMIRREINDKGGIADCLNNIGMLHSSTDHQKSLEYYSEALVIHRELGYKDRISNVLNNIGNIYIDLKEYDKVQEYYAESIKLREEIGDKNGLLNSLLNLSDSYINTKKFKLAKQLLEKAAPLAKKDELLKSHEYYQIYAKYCKGTKQFEKALESYQKYNEKYFEIFSKNHSTKIAELQSKYELEKKERENRIFQLKNVELQNALHTIKEKNNELREQSEELELTSRILRHDISNNLTVINSALRIYQKSENKMMLDEIPRQVKKSIDLIQALGKMQALIKESHKKERCQLSPILDKLIAIYKGIDISYSGDAFVWADTTLDSVFDNLISNSLRHGKTSRIKVIIEKNEDTVLVKFCDWGGGIPDAIKGKIFEENFIYGKSGHTGLGLFIVKRSIHKFGGYIKVSDNKPNGTCFDLTFKAAD